MITPLMCRTIARSRDEIVFSEYFHFSPNVTLSSERRQRQTGKVLLFTACFAQMQFCQLSCMVTARKEAQSEAPEQVGHRQANGVCILLPCFHPAKHLHQVNFKLLSTPRPPTAPPRRPAVVAVAVSSSIRNEVASELELIENLWEGAICGF